MYNMEIYCTRPYCIENPYWTPRLRHIVTYFTVSMATLYFTGSNYPPLLKIKTTYLPMTQKNKRYAYKINSHPMSTILLILLIASLRTHNLR